MIIQINKEVDQMQRVTQQNAATAEEAAASSEELNSQAEYLKEIVYELVKLTDGNKKV